MHSPALAATAGRTSVSRETLIGLAAITLAVVTMTFDHLIGSDPGLEDPVAFVITVSLSLALWGVLFGRVIPRTKTATNPGETAATRGLVCSLLALFPGVPTMFVGLPFVLSAGAIALGLLGRDSSKSGRARAAIVIGSLVLALALWYLGLTAWSKD
jgi:hypothetical protein